MSKVRRAQVMMEPREYKTLEGIARRENSSVAELIRRAIRDRYFSEDSSKQEALRKLRAMELPIDDDWSSLSDEVAEARANAFP
jgi:hypothetical protein